MNLNPFDFSRRDTWWEAALAALPWAVCFYALLFLSIIMLKGE